MMHGRIMDPYDNDDDDDDDLADDEGPALLSSGFHPLVDVPDLSAEEMNMKVDDSVLLAEDVRPNPTWQDVILNYPSSVLVGVGVGFGVLLLVMAVMCCVCCHYHRLKKREEDKLIQATARLQEKQAEARRHSKAGQQPIEGHHPREPQENSDTEGTDLSSVSPSLQPPSSQASSDTPDTQVTGESHTPSSVTEDESTRRGGQYELYDDIQQDHNVDSMIRDPAYVQDQRLVYQSDGLPTYAGRTHSSQFVPHNNPDNAADYEGTDQQLPRTGSKSDYPKVLFSRIAGRQKRSQSYAGPYLVEANQRSGSQTRVEKRRIQSDYMLKPDRPLSYTRVPSSSRIPQKSSHTAVQKTQPPPGPVRQSSGVHHGSSTFAVPRVDSAMSHGEPHTCNLHQKVSSTHGFHKCHSRESPLQAQNGGGDKCSVSKAPSQTYKTEKTYHIPHRIESQPVHQSRSSSGHRLGHTPASFVVENEQARATHRSTSHRGAPHVWSSSHHHVRPTSSKMSEPQTKSSTSSVAKMIEKYENASPPQSTCHSPQMSVSASTTVHLLPNTAATKHDSKRNKCMQTETRVHAKSSTQKHSHCQHGYQYSSSQVCSCQRCVNSHAQYWTQVETSHQGGGRHSPVRHHPECRCPHVHHKQRCCCRGSCEVSMHGLHSFSPSPEQARHRTKSTVRPCQVCHTLPGRIAGQGESSAGSKHPAACQHESPRFHMESEVSVVNEPRFVSQGHCGQCAHEHRQQLSAISEVSKETKSPQAVKRQLSTLVRSGSSSSKMRASRHEGPRQGSDQRFLPGSSPNSSGDNQKPRPSLSQSIMGDRERREPSKTCLKQTPSTSQGGAGQPTRSTSSSQRVGTSPQQRPSTPKIAFQDVFIDNPKTSSPVRRSKSLDKTKVDSAGRSVQRPHSRTKGNVDKLPGAAVSRNKVHRHGSNYWQQRHFNRHDHHHYPFCPSQCTVLASSSLETVDETSPQRSPHFRIDESRARKAMRKYGQRPVVYSKLPLPSYPYCLYSPREEERRARVRHYHLDPVYDEEECKENVSTLRRNVSDQSLQPRTLSSRYHWSRSCALQSDRHKVQDHDSPEEWDFRHPPYSRVPCLKRNFRHRERISPELPFPQYPYYIHSPPVDSRHAKRSLHKQCLHAESGHPAAEWDYFYPTERKVSGLRRTFSNESKNFKKLLVPSYPHYPCRCCAGKDETSQFCRYSMSEPVCCAKTKQRVHSHAPELYTHEDVPGDHGVPSLRKYYNSRSVDSSRKRYQCHDVPPPSPSTSPEKKRYKPETEDDHTYHGKVSELTKSYSRDSHRTAKLPYPEWPHYPCSPPPCCVKDKEHTVQVSSTCKPCQCSPTKQRSHQSASKGPTTSPRLVQPAGMRLSNASSPSTYSSTPDLTKHHYPFCPEKCESRIEKGGKRQRVQATYGPVYISDSNASNANDPEDSNVSRSYSSVGNVSDNAARPVVGQNPQHSPSSTNVLLNKGRSSPKLSNKGHSSPKLSNKGRTSSKISNKGCSSPKLSNKGHSSPKLSNKGHSSPKLSNKGHSSPKLSNKGHSSSKLSNKGHSSPKLSNKGHSSPKLSNKGRTSSKVPNHSSPKLSNKGHTSPKLSNKGRSPHQHSPSSTYLLSNNGHGYLKLSNKGRHSAKHEVHRCCGDRVQGNVTALRKTYSNQSHKKRKLQSPKWLRASSSSPYPKISRSKSPTCPVYSHSSGSKSAIQNECDCLCRFNTKRSPKPASFSKPYSFVPSSGVQKLKSPDYDSFPEQNYNMPEAHVARLKRVFSDLGKKQQKSFVMEKVRFFSPQSFSQDIRSSFHPDPRNFQDLRRDHTRPDRIAGYKDINKRRAYKMRRPLNSWRKTEEGSFVSQNSNESSDASKNNDSVSAGREFVMHRTFINQPKPRMRSLPYPTYPYYPYQSYPYNPYHRTATPQPKKPRRARSDTSVTDSSQETSLHNIHRRGRVAKLRRVFSSHSRNFRKPRSNRKFQKHRPGYVPHSCHTDSQNDRHHSKTTSAQNGLWSEDARFVQRRQESVPFGYTVSRNQRSSSARRPWKPLNYSAKVDPPASNLFHSSVASYQTPNESARQRRTYNFPDNYNSEKSRDWHGPSEERARESSSGVITSRHPHNVSKRFTSPGRCFGDNEGRHQWSGADAEQSHAGGWSSAKVPSPFPNEERAHRALNRFGKSRLAYRTLPFPNYYYYPAPGHLHGGMGDKTFQKDNLNHSNTKLNRTKRRASNESPKPDTRNSTRHSSHPNRTSSSRDSTHHHHPRGPEPCKSLMKSSQSAPRFPSRGDVEPTRHSVRSICKEFAKRGIRLSGRTMAPGRDEESSHLAFHRF